MNANRRIWTVCLAAVLCGAAASRAAGQTLAPDTEQAWAAYVAATEARIAGELSSPRGFFALDFTPDARTDRAQALSGVIQIAEVQPRASNGEPFPVPDGSITHWRGSVLVPGVTLDGLLERAQHPSEQGPFQPDVLALRVLERRPHGLTLFIKMRRQKIVTVTYNTEHELTYKRESPTRASSRSVATKIAEVEKSAAGERELPHGDDHGFLWRLNSYWRYEQVAGGVLVELESLSLSRDIPWGLGVLARPVITRVARESMERTLVFFREEQTRVRPSGH
jgi:hypothetical protein